MPRRNPSVVERRWSRHPNAPSRARLSVMEMCDDTENFKPVGARQKFMTVATYLFDGRNRIIE